MYACENELLEIQFNCVQMPRSIPDLIWNILPNFTDSCCSITIKNGANAYEYEDEAKRKGYYRKFEKQNAPQYETYARNFYFIIIITVIILIIICGCAYIIHFTNV